MPLFGAPEKRMNTSQDALNRRSRQPTALALLRQPAASRTQFAHALGMAQRYVVLALSLIVASQVACSRTTKVYSDPSALAVNPVSTDGRSKLPKDFYNQSVNQATVELQPDGATSTSKAIRFQTTSAANGTGGFNGPGIGNRAVLGLGSWHSRPVSQAEPLTFDAQVFGGFESVGISLQIDLKCDGADVRVVHAAGAAIASGTGSAAAAPAGDGYTRLTASQTSAIWLSPSAPIFDAQMSMILVPASGPAVSLAALLSAYPAACLKNASTGAADLPRGIPTAAILWSLGTDNTASNNSTLVRRFTVGNEVFEGLE